MIIIHSSKYVNAEFEAEVGPIPLCMLPIGNKKLLELQVTLLRKNFVSEKIIVTLPKSYHLSTNEQKLINELNISIQRISDTIDFAQAMLYVLNIEIESCAEPIRILQGDLLLNDVPLAADCIAITIDADGCGCSDKYQCQDSETHWLGYFSFSCKANLVKALTMSDGGFLEAIVHYQDYIDIVKAQPQDWYDCSKLKSYFDARSSITTQRSFNALIIESGIVTKTSDYDVKIQAEIHWFSHLPPKLKRYTPQFIDSGRLQDGITSFYCLEFLPLLPLNELYVHGRNPIRFWHDIFYLIKDYFCYAASQEYFCSTGVDKIDESRDDLYHQKTLGRLHAYQQSSHVDLQASVFYQGVELGSIADMAQDCIDKTIRLPSQPVIMHGDLCFSNMLFDSRAHSLKLIDPRGLDCYDNFTIFGDVSYDLAKLAHSVLGMYDFIIAGRFEIVADDSNGSGQVIRFDMDERLQRIQAEFLQFNFFDDIAIIDIMPAVVLLFLSMLPLHADRPDRQQAMLLNAFRLYKEHVFQDTVSIDKTLRDHDFPDSISLNNIVTNLASNEQIYSDTLEK